MSAENEEVFISVDVETSGPIPGEYSLLTIGACVVYDDRTSFGCRLKPISSNAVTAAMQVTGLSLEELERNGTPPGEAMSAFREWVGKACGSNGKPVFVGLNAPFDWSFVNYYFHRFSGDNPFGFNALDIKAMFMGLTGCRWRDTKSSEMDKILKPTLTGTHDAIDDARYQAELFRLIRAKIVVQDI
jgi:ribonuclease T